MKKKRISKYLITIGLIFWLNNFYIQPLSVMDEKNEMWIFKFSDMLAWLGMIMVVAGVITGIIALTEYIKQKQAKSSADNFEKILNKQPDKKK